MKTPMKNPSRVSKWGDVSNFTAGDAKSTGKAFSKHNETVSKMLQNSSHQKVHFSRE